MRFNAGMVSAETLKTTHPQVAAIAPHTGSCKRTPRAPSTANVAPVKNPESSDASQTAARATSSGCPIRPAGWNRSNSARDSGRPSKPASSIGVEIAAGAMALTRTRPPKSTAKARVSPAN